MSPTLLIVIVVVYFGLLLLISQLTSKDRSNQVFFKAHKNSPWYIVAFGMIGASLSGVTFISVPGWVNSTQMSYMQIVFGYLLGYLVIAYVLLPIYYRQNITSIYQYLNQRMGKSSHLTASLFFLLSRILIASFRLFLIVTVLQYFILDHWNIPFEFTVVLSVGFIWLYTYRSGIKTIIWTDTLQTIFMLSALVISILAILDHLQMSAVDYLNSENFLSRSKIWFTDDIKDKKYWLKSVLGGMFIAIAMTGLDQDNMQKNLTCKSLKEAQKNMISFGIILIPVNLIFLVLGTLLFSYADKMAIAIPLVEGLVSSDLLFPKIALDQGLEPGLALVFILGLIAATYSSADSALTSMTTSFSIDFLDIEQKDPKSQQLTRKLVHIFFSLLIVMVVIIYRHILHDNIISSLLLVASYTYGPLLGLFSFGLFTKYKLNEKWVILVSLLSVVLTYILNQFAPIWLNGYSFGYDILLLNGIFMFTGLLIIRKPPATNEKIM